VGASQGCVGTSPVPGVKRKLARLLGTGRRRTTQAIGQQHTSPLRAGCEARRREIVLIFVVVMAWCAMALGLLKLMAGLGRAVPRGCRLNPGGTPGPVRISSTYTV